MKLRNLPRFRMLLSCLTLCCCTLYLTGCSGSSESSTASSSDDDHGHDHGDDGHSHGDGHSHDDGHDHGSHGHEGHDHPAHGPNGGHMVELSGGLHAEWTHDDRENLIRVYADEVKEVEKVVMKVAVEGQEPTEYSFEPGEADGKSFYELTSPELLTSVKMGKLVDTQLVITTKEGEVSGQVEHHAH